MSKENNILLLVQTAARKRILFLPHAIRQMSQPKRLISRREVRNVILHGKVIEDYPEDARGHSCLMMGLGDHSRVIHVVCSLKKEFLAIITAYMPDPDVWNADFNQREI